MILNQEVHNTFPIPIFVGKVERRINKKTLDFVGDLKKIKQDGSTLRSEDSFILDTPEMFPWKEEIEHYVNQSFYELMSPLSPLKLKITQSWTSYQESNEGLSVHRHTNSILSGVFYLQVNPSEDVICFVKERELFGNIEIPCKKFNQFNNNLLTFNVTDGMIILFPSTLHHFVPPNLGAKGTRISLAFNTFFEGQIGDKENLNLSIVASEPKLQSDG
jgi:uncharacterized protein (TIGR02466 family)